METTTKEKYEAMLIEVENEISWYKKKLEEHQMQKFAIQSAIEKLKADE